MGGVRKSIQNHIPLPDPTRTGFDSFTVTSYYVLLRELVSRLMSANLESAISQRRLDEDVGELIEFCLACTVFRLIPCTT